MFLDPFRWTELPSYLKIELMFSRADMLHALENLPPYTECRQPCLVNV